MKKTILFVIAFILIFNCAFAGEQKVEVLFLSKCDLTDLTFICGLVKIIINDKKELVGYISLNIKWKACAASIMLYPGIYGVTKYDPLNNKFINYKQFEVKDKKITIRI